MNKIKRDKMIRRKESDVISVRYRGSEEKNYDVQVYAKSVVSTLTNSSLNPATTSPLNAQVTGSGPNNMTGRRYLLSKLSINGVFRCLSANADPVEHVVRLVIYIDKQSLAASGSSQFGNLNSIYLEPTDTRNRVNTFQNLDVSERFVILRDKRWAFRPTANVSSTEPIDVSIPFEYHFDLKRRRMEVEVGTNGAGTPTNYSLNIGAVTSGGTVTVDYFARVMFFDEDV